MKIDNDNLLQSLLPDLEDHLGRMRAELTNLDAKRNDLATKIHDLEQKLNVIRSSGQECGTERKPRKPRGANRTAILSWFEAHPTEAIGQTQMAEATGMTSSSARAVLDRLVKEGIIHRDDGCWRKKPLEKGLLK